MIDPEFLKILACPETKQSLQAADAPTLARVNAAIDAGSLLTRANQKVTRKIEAGLVRRDGQVLYPIREEIPVMLIEESIALTGLR